MSKLTILPDAPALTYTVDRGKLKTPPSFWDGKRDIPGTKKALRVLSHSRINSTNLWCCTLHFLSAN